MTKSDQETVEEQTETKVDPSHMRNKEEPFEGEVNPLLHSKQCYQISSHIDNHEFMLGGGLQIELPKGGTQTSYREIIKLHMIRTGTYPTVRITKLVDAADKNARRANKAIVFTIGLWGVLAVLLHVWGNMPWIPDAIVLGVIFGWKLIPDFYRARRAAQLYDRTKYEQQLLRENFNEDEANHPDLQDIHQFNHYMDECNFQEAGEIARKNDWFQLINRQYLTKHYGNMMRYFQTIERGKKAKKSQ